MDDCTNVTDSVVRVIGQSRVLRNLELRGGELGSDGLRPLAALQTLRSLKLNVDAETVCWSPVFELGQVEELRVGKGPREPAAAARIVPQLHRLRCLRSLRLHEVRAPDEAHECLGKLLLLERAYVNGNPHLGSVAIRAFADLPLLRDLDVGRTAVNGDDLAVLSRSGSIEGLGLVGCANVTDDGLDALANMPSLRYVGLVGCDAISADAVAAFEETRPDCFVLRPDGTLNWSRERLRALQADFRRRTNLPM